MTKKKKGKSSIAISFRSFHWSLLLPITIELFPFFLFHRLCLYISDSLHLFTLFLTDSLEKCQTKSSEDAYSTFCNLLNILSFSHLILLRLTTSGKIETFLKVLNRSKFYWKRFAVISSKFVLLCFLGISDFSN